jgi:hypothetical protein
MKSAQSKSKAQLGWAYGIISLDGKEGYFDPLSIPLQLDYKDTTLGALLFELVEFKQAHNEAMQRVKDMKIGLQQFLTSNGYELSGDTLESLITDIKRVQVVNPTHTHTVAFNKDGYIKELIDIEVNQLIANAQKPADYRGGFYKVENGRIVLDKKRKEQLLSLD